MLRKVDFQSRLIRVVVATAIFAMGWLLCLLPAWVHRAETFWIWNAVGATVMAYSYAMQSLRTMPQHGAMMLLICPVALSLALTEDFALFSPDAVLTLCGESFGWNALLLHAQFYPVTTATMLVLTVFVRTGASQQRLALPWRVAEALIGIIIMMIAMESSIMLLRELARLVNWPWVANGVVCAMLAGMILFHLATPAVRRIFLMAKMEVAHV